MSRVNRWLDELSDSNAEVVQAAAIALGESRDPRAVEPLLALLGQENCDVRVREAAIEALGELGDKRAVETLMQYAPGSRVAVCSIAKLKDDRASSRLVEIVASHNQFHSVWNDAVKALKDLGVTDVCEPLVELLRSSHYIVSENAARALGAVGGPRAVEPLCRALLGNQHFHTRTSAAESLGKLGDRRATAALIQALDDAGRTSDVNTVGYFDVRESAARALGRIGDPAAVSSLLVHLAQGSPGVIAALGSLGVAEIVPTLIPLLEHSSESIRLAAAEALGNLRAIESVPALIRCLSDRDAKTRGAAAHSLGKLGDFRAIPPLLAMLPDAEKQVGGVPKTALCALKSGVPLEPLMALSWNPLETVREQTAAILGELENRLAADTLMRMLGDEKTSVRVAAAEALGKLGDQRAKPRLIALLGECWDRHRPTVALSLARLGDPRWQQWIRGDRNDFGRLGRSGSPAALEPLVAALSGLEHVEAALALGELGDARAVEALIEVVRSKAGNSRTRNAAIHAISLLGDRRATPYLIELLEDYHSSTNAAMALAALKDPIALKPLTAALEAHRGKYDEPLFFRALIRFGCETVTEPVRTRLLSAEGATRRLAAETLANYGEPKWSAWVQGDGKDLVRLATSGDAQAWELLIQYLEHPSKEFFGGESGTYGHGFLSDMVVEAIGESDCPAAVDTLVTYLERAQEPLRMLPAILALGKLGDTRAAPSLARQLDSSTTVEVILTAGEALNSLGQPLSPTVLVDLLARDHNESYRVRAADILAAGGFPQWKRLVRGNDDDFLRLAAAGHPGAIKKIFSGLRTTCQYQSARKIRLQSARWLIALAKSGTIDVLRHWRRLLEQMDCRHTDSHSDHPKSSDCGSSHQDKGIGLGFMDRLRVRSVERKGRYCVSCPNPQCRRPFSVTEEQFSGTIRCPHCQHEAEPVVREF